VEVRHRRVYPGQVRALVVVSLLILTAAPAAGDEAAKLHQGGKAAFAARDYERAADLFRQAYQRTGDPALLFNNAQSLRLARRCGDAAAAYREFLGKVPDASNRADVEEMIAEMDRCTPAPAPPREPDPVPVVTVTAPAARPSGRTSRAGLWVAAGGGAALIASTVFWYRAHQADRELDELVAGGGVYDRHHQQLTDRRKREGAIAVVSASVGAAAVAGGLLYHFLLAGRRSEAPTLRGGVDQSGASLSFEWGF
jgi:tetratricopeptide (TPR) repeat protein